MKKSFIVLGIIIGAVSALAAFGIVTGNGKVIDEYRDVKNFQGINVSGAGTVILTQGKEYSCEVSLDSNLQKIYLTTVKSGVLNMGFKPGSSVNKYKKLEVRITLPTLKSVEGSGAVRIELQNEFSGKELSFKLSGASKLQGSLQYKVFGLRVSGASLLDLSGGFGAIAVEASGNSKIGMDGTFDDITLDVSGSTDFTVKGRGIALGGTVSGASTIDLEGCDLANADINASGASSIHLGEVEKTIKANLSGASNMRYRGSPEIEQSLSGGSSIRRAK
jgi:hypothetical protein